jgi:hypothetical protein
VQHCVIANFSEELEVEDKGRKRHSPTFSLLKFEPNKIIGAVGYGK